MYIILKCLDIVPQDVLALTAQPLIYHKIVATPRTQKRTITAMMVKLLDDWIEQGDFVVTQNL